MIRYFSVAWFDNCQSMLKKTKQKTLHVGLINIRKDAERIASWDKYCDLDKQLHLDVMTK